jgi:hypothetical protein
MTDLVVPLSGMSVKAGGKLQKQVRHLLRSLLVRNSGRAELLNRVIRSDGSLNVGKKVARQLSGERSFVPVQSILSTIASGKRIADPQGVEGFFLFTSKATFNGTKGTLEVLVDESSGKILHVLFKRRAR